MKSDRETIIKNEVVLHIISNNISLPITKHHNISACCCRTKWRSGVLERILREALSNEVVLGQNIDLQSVNIYIEYERGLERDDQRQN